jgi:hypothetical protein
MACVEETFVASPSRGQELVQHIAADTPNDEDPFGVFEGKALELEHDKDQWGKKMHRYPASIRELGYRYTVPTIMSIGPYHHGRDHLKKAEEAKHVAAYSCIKHSGLSVQEMYDAVASVAREARSLYERDTMAGIEDDEFLPMMFYDACFLMQFMLWTTSETGTTQMHPWLDYFLKSNKGDIYHDVMLLENQLPWVVVETLARFSSVDLQKFAKGFKLHNSHSHAHTPSMDLEAQSSAITHDSTLDPPHLLGYVRFYLVGTSKTKMYRPDKEAKVISISVSATELAGMGITLRPSKTTELSHMGFKEAGPLFAEVFLPHILLTYARASYLLNMAAFEITSKPRPDHGEDTAVCSYFQLLGMLMDREKDVQELRSKGLLPGGGGLTDKETLDFFTSLRVTRGLLYHRTIRDVEMYKQKRRTWVKVYAFYYKYKKTMLAVLSVVATLSGILGALRKR